MQLATYHPSTSAVWADALFVSVLQRSDEPDTGQVRRAIAAVVRAYGGPGCAERVAQEFGDHPEAAVTRMRWARAVAGEAFASPTEPAQESGRRRHRRIHGELIASERKLAPSAVLREPVAVHQL